MCTHEIDKCKYIVLVYMHRHVHTHCLCHTPSNYNTVTDRQANDEVWSPATISSWDFTRYHDTKISHDSSPTGSDQMQFNSVVWSIQTTLQIAQSIYWCAFRVANRPVFPGTSRFSAYMSRVPAKAAPGRIMSRFSAGLYSHSKSHAEMPRKTDTYV